MTNKAWLGLIREVEGNSGKFVVRSYDCTITSSSVLQSKSDSQVRIDSIKVREFEPTVRATMSPEELDSYKVNETTPGQNWILDVYGDIAGFNESEVIYIF